MRTLPNHCLDSEEATIALGKRLGRKLQGGAVILLRGEIGAGKTTFVRGLARGAGYLGWVSSPTFAFIHSYRSKRLTVHHLDLYRLARGEDAELGLEELLADPRAAMVVEWPDAAGDMWPKDRLEVTFSHFPGGRRVVMKATGPCARALRSSRIKA